MRRWFAWTVFLGAGLAGCSSSLQGGLDEREANEMVLILSQAGIESEKQKTGSSSEAAFSVQVSPTDLSRAWQVVQGAGLPRPRHSGFLGIYKEPGLVPGRTEEQARFLAALQEEIAKTLESVDGVVSARVHVTMRTEGRPGRDDPRPASASVLVCYLPDATGGFAIGEAQVQKLVAYAVEGLIPEKVAVVQVPRQLVRAGRAAINEGGADLIKTASAGVASLALLIAFLLFAKWAAPRIAQGTRRFLPVLRRPRGREP